MCIRDRIAFAILVSSAIGLVNPLLLKQIIDHAIPSRDMSPVSYTHLRAHETVLDLVCRLLLEKKKNPTPQSTARTQRLSNRHVTKYYTPSPIISLLHPRLTTNT